MRAIRIGMVLCWMLGVFTDGLLARQGEEGEVLQYRIMTDRAIYMVGEELRFRVFNLNSDSLLEMGWSRVFYLELISPQGDPYVQLKLPLDADGSSGVFKVPRELPSGTYYLKGYTRFLRNLGPSYYSYLSIKVVNPFVKTVLAVDTLSRFTVPLIRQDWGCDFIDPVPASEVKSIRSRTGSAPGFLNVPAHLRWNGCIAVARPEALQGQYEFTVPIAWSESAAGNQIPETRGVTLTGTVRVSNTQRPVPYAVVYVTSLDGKKEFYCNYADSLGKFYIVLEDKHEEADLFISAAHADTEDLEVLVDQDFCNEPLLLPSFPISLESEGAEAITEICINAQIREQYAADVSEPEDTVTPAGRFFYGEPSATVRFSDFIKLPTLEEYIAEVIPEVTIRKSEANRILRVMGSNPDLMFYDPLLLVDGVAVFDIESVLAISPRYVDRVELVTAPYVRGNVTFGGIINLVTIEGNMGYMNLPASGLLLNYRMFSNSGGALLSAGPTDPRLPDLRNTLAWMPLSESNSEEKHEVPVFAADLKGRYCVLIRGYDDQGRYLEQSFPLEVE